MNNKILIAIFSAFLCVATAVSAQEMSLEKKASLEKQALQGSGLAAREIALFHGTRDDRLFEYWNQIGAENGDGLCQYNYASILWDKKDSYSKMRAIYWMRKAAAKKVHLAEESLGNMLREQK